MPKETAYNPWYYRVSALWDAALASGDIPPDVRALRGKALLEAKRAYYNASKPPYAGKHWYSGSVGAYYDSSGSRRARWIARLPDGRGRLGDYETRDEAVRARQYYEETGKKLKPTRHLGMRGVAKLKPYYWRWECRIDAKAHVLIFKCLGQALAARNEFNRDLASMGG